MQSVPLGLLEVRLHIHADHEAELNDWYDREHVPELLRSPGVLSATRYTEMAAGIKMHRAFYELDGASVTLGKDFQRLLVYRTAWSTRMYALYDNLHRIRHTYRLVAAGGKSSPFNAPWLYCFKTDVASEMEEEFNKSYDDGLLEALATVDGCVGARRFVVTEGHQKYLSLYGLESLGVVDSDAWLAVANTPRRTKIRAHLLGATKSYCKLLRSTILA